MLYPNGGQYYAYDANAQNGANLPPTMAKNPLPGWKTGTSGKTSAQVTAWINWYIGALDNVTDWQMTTFTALGFTGYFQTLTPGSGWRPLQLASSITNNLPSGQTLAVGSEWALYYAQLPHKQRVVAYVSSVADHSGGDDSCDASDMSVAINSPAAADWSATRFTSRIAALNGLPVAGENPGYDAPSSFDTYYKDTGATGMMATALRQAQTCNFQTFYWAHDSRLWDGTQTFANYAGFIQSINNGRDTTPGFPS